MRLLQLRADFARCHIQPALQSLSFIDWAQVPKNLKDLYSIWEQDRCIYVGKTGSTITTRLLHHNNKARAVFEQGTRDTLGWRTARSRTTWAPDTWTIEYFTCESAVARTYLEGAMMLLFDPECNDETVEDRLAGRTR